MIIELNCSHCSRKFSVGGYQIDDVNSGYVGRRMLVCKKCGTQHAINIAGISGPEFLDVLRVVVESVTDAGKPSLLRELRRLRNVSSAAAYGLMKALPITLLEEATSAEAERVSKSLGAKGILCKVEITSRRRNRHYTLARKPHQLLIQEVTSGGEKEWIVVSELPDQRINASTAELSCGKCSSVALADTLEEGASCPSCSEGCLHVTSTWIT